MTGPAAALRGTKWDRALPLLALGELLVDKLPKTPSRTKLPLLAARAASGAISGAVTAKRYGTNRWLGTVLGSAGAVGAAYLGAAYREGAARRRIPPLLAALVEDVAAIALGLALTRRADP